MKTYFFLFIGLIFITYQSCIDSDDINLNINSCTRYYKKMPPISQRGAHEFACYINGEPWVAYTDLLSQIFLKGDPEIDADYSTTSHLFSIRSKRAIFEMDCDTSDATMFLKTWNLTLGENDLVYSSSIFKDFYNEAYYRLDTLSPHVLIINKIDTANQFIAGEFEFIGIDDDKADTIFVTGGRFDAHY